MAKTVETIWSDIDHRLIKDSQGRIKRSLNLDAVSTSIDNILRTRKGERCMLPDFGCDLRDYVFESMTSTQINLISRDIKDSIERWEPRVRVTEVSFEEDPDMNSIYVVLRFQIRGYNRIFKYETPIKGPV